MQFRLQVITTLLIINGASLLGSGEGPGKRSDLTGSTVVEKLTPEERAKLLERLHAKIDKTKSDQAERSSRRRDILKNVTIGKPKSGQG